MKHYAQRDIRALGQRYADHVSAMTAEGLHAKSAIAVELAWRDERIAEQKQVIAIYERMALGFLALGEDPRKMGEPLASVESILLDQRNIAEDALRANGFTRVGGEWKR